MTNRLAIILGLIILAALVADREWLHAGLPLYLVQQMTGLVEWISFWR